MLVLIYFIFKDFKQSAKLIELQTELTITVQNQDRILEQMNTLLTKYLIEKE